MASEAVSTAVANATVQRLLSREPAVAPSPEDETFQSRCLQGVSRTFALTIPQLPRALARAVANAYLLCRVADTIEDDPGILPDEKVTYLEAFLAELERGGDGALLASALAPRLSGASLPAERELIHGLPRILRITRSLSTPQRHAMVRCVAIMGRGMALFSRRSARAGLETLEDLQRYCYHVAGVVGEMLTDLFCHHSPSIAVRRPRLATLAASFGQALQLTNILKDVWTDLERGACWLPRRLFAEEGYDLDVLPEAHRDDGFSRGLLRLVAVAHGSLRDALEYVKTVPRRETGVRRFLIWAIGLSALTLSRIADNPTFTDRSQVKVSRTTVRRVVLATNLAIRSNAALEMLFRRWSRGLPAPVFTTAAVAAMSPDGWALRD